MSRNGRDSAWIVLLVMLGFLFFSTEVKAEPKGFKLSSDKNRIKLNIESVLRSKISGYDQLQVPGLSNFASEGEPSLPIKTVRFLVPNGKQVTNVKYIRGKRTFLGDGFKIAPAPYHSTLNRKIVSETYVPKKSVYSSNNPFPNKQIESVSVQRAHGFEIYIFNLHPFEYLPASGRVTYFNELEVEVELKTAETAVLGWKNFRGTSADRQAISSLVDNPDSLESYPMSTVASLADCAYLIITTNAFKDAFQPLVTHKQSRGITAEVITVEEIYANPAFTGADNQAKIRSCIAHYYTNNNTRYVLLGGDADGSGVLNGETDSSALVPSRGFTASVLTSSGTETDNNIPADHYYACLDGTFDFDGDGIYGEPTDGVAGGEVDLLAEVYVGRAPVDSVTEVNNFVAKTITYENGAGSYLKQSLLLGEKLDDDTYGKAYMEEVRLGSVANGYTTEGMGSSGYFSFQTLYDQDAEWTADELSSKLNSGVHVVNHVGHANVTVLGKAFNNYSADSLTNTNYFLGFTQGCYSGSFDNRWSDLTYGSQDCVLEHFVCRPNGAFAFIGSSRYGWYSPGSTNGASHRFQREFWDAIMKDNIVNLGASLQSAKADCVGEISSSAIRWSYYSLNLLGDPQTALNANLLCPYEFTASNISFGNSSWVTLRWVNTGRTDVSGTMVRYRTDGIYPTDENDGTLVCDRTVVTGQEDFFNHTGIVPGKTYHYVAFGYTAAGVYGGADATANRTTLTILGPGPVKSSGGSSCFVATACYGDPEAMEVRALRRFRDEIMMHSQGGRKLIAAYYVGGPFLADYIRHDPGKRKVVRCLLGPIVKAATFLTQ